MKKEKVIILVYGSGGHNEQMKRLLLGLKNNLNVKNHKFISFIDNDVKYHLTDVNYEVPTITDKYSYIKSLLKLPYIWLKIFQSLVKLNKRYKFDYMISTGPGICILVSIILRLVKRKVKIIYIETWSRFYSKSGSGRVMYYLADYFFVQNIELTKIYKKAIFKGRL